MDMFAKPSAARQQSAVTTTSPLPETIPAPNEPTCHPHPKTARQRQRGEHRRPACEDTDAAVQSGVDLKNKASAKRFSRESMNSSRTRSDRPMMASASRNPFEEDCPDTSRDGSPKNFGWFTGKRSRESFSSSFGIITKNRANDETGKILKNKLLLLQSGHSARNIHLVSGHPDGNIYQ
jgi:hypothetical protein